MQWIAPSEKDAGTETLENRLWAAADQLRANSGLTSAQYTAELYKSKCSVVFEHVFETFAA